MRGDPIVAMYTGLASVSSSFAAVATWSSPFGFIGIPAPVAFMAFAGASAGLIAHPPTSKLSRWAMLTLTLSFTFFAASGAVFLGGLPHCEFLREVAPAVAGLLAYFAQTVVPAVRRRAVQEIRSRGSTANGDSP